MENTATPSYLSWQDLMRSVMFRFQIDHSWGGLLSFTGQWKQWWWAIRPSVRKDWRCLPPQLLTVFKQPLGSTSPSNEPVCLEHREPSISEFHSSRCYFLNPCAILRLPSVSEFLPSNFIFEVLRDELKWNWLILDWSTSQNLIHVN